jgi:hypothetical protein
MDPYVVKMRESCPGDITFFSYDPTHPVIVAHRAQDKRVVFFDGADIVAAKGIEEIHRIPVKCIPMTSDGLLPFQIENATSTLLYSFPLPHSNTGFIFGPGLIASYRDHYVRLGPNMSKAQAVAVELGSKHASFRPFTSFGRPVRWFSRREQVPLLFDMYGNGLCRHYWHREVGLHQWTSQQHTRYRLKNFSLQHSSLEPMIFDAPLVISFPSPIRATGYLQRDCPRGLLRSGMCSWLNRTVPWEF